MAPTAAPAEPFRVEARVYPSLLRPGSSWAPRGGNRSDPSKKATLYISSDGSALEIVVEDEGEGFRLDDLADPTSADNLLKPSGRGILIIRSFMDEVNLSPREGGGSRLRMVKRLTGDAS